MTTNQAIQIVVRAAEGYARGSQHCMEILRACEMVREMNKPPPMNEPAHWKASQILSVAQTDEAALLHENHIGLLKDMQRMDKGGE